MALNPLEAVALGNVHDAGGGDIDCTSDSGDVAWMLTSTVLVLSMMPGLAFFEAGLLRMKNSVSIMTQCLFGLSILACMWVSFGYMFTFGKDFFGVIGFDPRKLFFYDVDYSGCISNAPIPESLYATFQMMFACITPLLVTGTVAERMRWHPYVVFIIVWEVLCYYPIAHSVWGGGWLFQMKVQDFAGGIVIHASSGAAALVAAKVLGKRQGWKRLNGVFPHSDMRMAVIGAAFLWTGWMGFNGGSALGTNAVALHAVLNTQVAACFSALVWAGLGWMGTDGKPSAFHVINGAVAGMAGITPASGYIDVPSAIGIAIIAGFVSFYGERVLHYFEIDDSLEVSCVHGATSVIGVIAVGLVAQTAINPMSQNGLFYGGDWKFLGVQVLALACVIAYSGTMTFLILKTFQLFAPLRARELHETQGLDISHHKLEVQHSEERLQGVSPLSRTEVVISGDSRETSPLVNSPLRQASTPQLKGTPAQATNKRRLANQKSMPALGDHGGARTALDGDHITVTWDDTPQGPSGTNNPNIETEFNPRRDIAHAVN